MQFRKSVVLFLCSTFATTYANQQVGQTVLNPADPTSTCCQANPPNYITIPQFVEPLPIPSQATGDNLTMTAQEFQQQILPASFYAQLPNSVPYCSNGAPTPADCTIAGGGPPNPVVANNIPILVHGKLECPSGSTEIARINPQKGTFVWGYSIKDNKSNVTYGPSVPAPTIVAQRGIPTQVQLVNNLVPYPGLPGPLLQKFLTVDQSFMWANPLNTPMTINGTDQLTYLPCGNPAFYAGPQPMIVHLHGNEIPSAYDGGPLDWFTPHEQQKGAGFVTTKFNYINTQPATTMWFHDHTLGETRLNVYAGLAGLYFLRGTPESQVSPALPQGPYEIGLSIQDRLFDTYGQIFFPDGNPLAANVATGASGLNGDPGNPGIHPYAIPEFFGDIITVNGKAWPYLNVEPRRYRFRILDASNARMYSLQLQDEKGLLPENGGKVPAIWQIGSDGGLFDNPVNINSFVPYTFSPANTPCAGNTVASCGASAIFSAPRLFLASAERADIIIDFSGYEGKTLTLVNDSPAPFPGNGAVSTNPALFEGNIMQFRVARQCASRDNSYDPASGKPLRSEQNKTVRLATLDGKVAPGVKIDKVRSFTLIEEEYPTPGSGAAAGSGSGGPVKVMINNTMFDGKNIYNGTPASGSVSYVNGALNVTEIPQVGSTEIWEFVNMTPDAHPIHIHLIQFQVLNRQVYNVGYLVPDYTPFTPEYYRYLYEQQWPTPPAKGVPSGIVGTVYGGGSPLDYFGTHLGDYLGTPKIGGNPNVNAYLLGDPFPADPNEQYEKDVIKMFPSTVTRLIVRWAPQETPVSGASAGQNLFSFDPTAQIGTTDKFGYPGGPGYVFHCHITDHEDNDMMRPIEIGNKPQP